MKSIFRYFLDCNDDEIEASEKQFFDLDFGDIPVLVIFKNEDELRNNVRDHLVPGSYPDDSTIARCFDEIIEKKKSEIKNLAVRSYVRSRDRKLAIQKSRN